MERPTSAGAASRRAVIIAAVAIAAAATALGVAVGALLGCWWLGGLIGLILGAGAVAWATRAAPGQVLGGTAATPADRKQYARLHNLVDGLCVANGLPVPEIEIMPSASMNAAVTARDDRHGTLLVTTGLIEQLDRIEMEGVVAHLLMRLRDGSIDWQTRAAALFGGLARPFAGLAALRAGSDDIWFVADEAACQATRYPPGMIAALAKLERGPTAIAAARPASSWLWLASPLDGGDSVGGVHPPLAQRIALLKEL